MSERREAGALLDAEVAERVMGATWKRHKGATGDWLAFDHEALGMLTGNVLAARITDGVQVWPMCPQYSTDIAAAWQVVEKMRERGFGFSLDSILSDDRPYHADFDNLRDTYMARANTAPLAICTAALWWFYAEGSQSTTQDGSQK